MILLSMYCFYVNCSFSELISLLHPANLHSPHWLPKQGLPCCPLTCWLRWEALDLKPGVSIEDAVPPPGSQPSSH